MTIADDYLCRDAHGNYIVPAAIDDRADRAHDSRVREAEIDSIVNYLHRNSYRMVADNGWFPLIKSLKAGDHRV